MLFLFSSLPSEAADARQLQEQRLHEALLRLAAGETDAMSVLYENSKTAVFALALSILKNRQDAEDILHDTFVQLYRMADRYDRGGRPLSWILTMTRNLCLMQLRRKSRTEVSAEDLEFPETENPFATAEDRMILQTAIRCLEDDERQIVMLHAVAGLKYREIAEQMHISLPAAVSRYHRALQKLQKHLKEA